MPKCQLKPAITSSHVVPLETLASAAMRGQIQALKELDYSEPMAWEMAERIIGRISGTIQRVLTHHNDLRAIASEGRPGTLAQLVCATYARHDGLGLDGSGAREV